MDYFLGFALLVALGVIVWMLWQQKSQKEQCRRYADLVQHAANGDAPCLALPRDEPGLETISNAVYELSLALQMQISRLDAQRARFANILDQMTDGVLIADPEGRVSLINPAAERLFSSPDAVGRSMAEVLRHHQLIQAWRTCQENGEMQIETVEIPARRQFLQLIVLPDSHTPDGTLLLVQDLTRLRRLETVRRDFISNVSHELRTPLASLKALTETLSEGALDDPPAARRFIGRIETEVDALTQMATELLDLSRIESGQVELALAEVSPQRLLNSAAERMKTQVERASLELTVACPPGLPGILADAPRIEQVLINLVHNAVKFTPSGGKLTLSAELDADKVRFGVTDTGSGIPAEDLPRIFERFYRVDRSRTGGGTGLGLSIARHLIEAHGGRIWAESREGLGSTFFFTIPCR